MTAAPPLNNALYRIHRIFFAAFALFIVLMLVASVSALIRGTKDASIAFVALAFLPIGLGHWYAAKGAREGKTYGKVLSRIFGTLWLFGVPLGTVLGIYVLYQTGSKWKAVGEAFVTASPSL